MADPIDPILDPPPHGPIDVPVNLDRPPSVPFDVNVVPDGPPVRPFDVLTNSDAAPRAPFDVPLSFDAPPTGPFDVSVSIDRPPTTPFDVAVIPDGGPRSTQDVTITPDLPPREPSDVAVYPDSPPRDPSDVGVVFDAPPRPPFDVPISLDLPPRAPTDVSTSPDLPALDVRSSPGRPPTIDQIVNAVIGFDRTLGTFLAGIIEIEPVSIDGPGAGALDPGALARWFRDYTSAVGGPAGVAKFISEQSILYAMNPITARIFDPTYFLKMLIPGSMGHAHTTVDVESGVTMKSVALIRDEVLRAAVSTNPERPGGDGLSDRPDVYGPENTYVEGQAYSVDSLVDAALGDSSSPYLKPTDVQGAIISRFDSSAFFEDRRSDGAMLVRATAKARAASGVENVMNSRLVGSNALDGIIRVGIPGERDDGSVISTTADPSDVVDDDDARVPISFTDLRQVPGKRFRSVYFRPENLQFGTSFAPEYSESSTFGRVDPVVGYQRTTRTVNVSFEVHAFAPEDLTLMYNKMTWLQSMVYPSYGSDSLMESGPVVRMRIGDVISTDLGGVPGVIRSLNFDFTDALWELKRGFKVPRMYKVALDFTVLHDGPVGTVNGIFGVFQLPPGGNAPGKDTNFAGNPTDSQDDRVDGVTALPGRFSKFGEPRS